MTNSAEHERGAQRAELFSAVLLSIATLLTAWSAYEATRWSGLQAIRFAEAASSRVESAKRSDEATTLVTIDAGLTLEFVDALFNDNRPLARELERRFFRAEFKPAFNDWFDRIDDPSGPATPFSSRRYKVRQQQRADRLAAVAEDRTEAAKDANQNGDNYIFATIFFAAVLFFAGISTKLTALRLQVATLSLGGAMLVGGILRVVTLPVA